jgi:CNH domain
VRYIANDIAHLLSDKVLWAYPIDALTSSQFANTRQKIKDSINYFNVGVCNSKTLIVPMKKRNTMSTFKAYEPVCGDIRDVLKHSNNAKTMFGNRATKEWVKVYKEFYVGADSTSVQFLRARIVVVCVKGFEIVNLENLSMNIGIPDLVKPEFAFVVRKGENIRPLAMFRIHDKFLLCYDEFAFFVDSRGGLLRDKNRIEWEGVPESVALYYPYVVAFDKEFVEVRHVETVSETISRKCNMLISDQGARVQVLAGDNLRCLHYSGNATRPVIHGAMQHEMNSSLQVVFQLLPNEALLRSNSGRN